MASELTSDALLQKTDVELVELVALRPLAEVEVGRLRIFFEAQKAKEEKGEVPNLLYILLVARANTRLAQKGGG